MCHKTEMICEKSGYLLTDRARSIHFFVLLHNTRIIISDNVHNMLRILHLTKYNKFDFIKSLFFTPF